MDAAEIKEAFDNIVRRDLRNLRVFKYDCMDLEYKEVQTVKRVVVKLPEGEEEIILVE